MTAPGGSAIVKFAGAKKRDEQGDTKMNIQQKTARTAAKMFKPRYGNFINGRWAEPLGKSVV